MNIIAMMVVKNEEGRYLEPALDWLSHQVDEIFVYDDGSTDDTRNIAARYAVVCPREKSRSSFLQHEGRFRTDALHTLETVIEPHDGDWIFVADADEFFVPRDEDLWDLIGKCQPHHEAIRIRIHTVWDQLNDGTLTHRVDGPWDTLYEPRLWKWRPALAFADKPMACRNEPVFITQNYGLQLSPENVGSAILHYGYASHGDRARRFQRYTALGDHGHSQVLIDSIHDSQVVGVSWPGKVPVDVR